MVAGKVKQWDECFTSVVSLYEFMKHHLPTHDLNQQEKNLFSSCFKNLIEQARKQWRTCYEKFQEEEDADPDESNFKLKCIMLTKKKIEEEIRQMCQLQYVIAKHFIKSEPAQSSLECRVFYYKTMADTFRYLHSIETNKEKQDRLLVEAEKRYLASLQEASELEATNTIRLASSLNYSVFLAEAKFDFEQAIKEAQRAFDDSLNIYQGLEKEKCEQVTRIMVLLKNNIEIFTLEKVHLDKIKEKEQ